MSLELSPTNFEVRSDVDGRLVLNHETKLIPVVQKYTGSNVDLVFPEPILYVREFTRLEGNWRIHAWGLAVAAYDQVGFVDLAPINAGIAPNQIIANLFMRRVGNPREDVWGPFHKSVVENAWTPVRSGVRLEYTAWLRRIAWLSIEAGYLRLNWKQSVRGYDPNQLDPNWASAFPQAYMWLKRPPAYQIGNYDQEGSSGRPPYPGLPSIHSGPLGTISFASVWRFDVMAWLLQL